MKKNKNVFAVTGDLGYGGFDEIMKDYPERFINCGASEQSMMGIACGLSLEGKIVFVYSITTFLLYRGFETIRNYINQERIKVILIGSGRDYDYEHDGFSHWAHDANKILTCLPNIQAHWPNNKEEIPGLMENVITSKNPSFISLRR